MLFDREPVRHLAAAREVDHAKKRQQFGRPVAQCQMTQARLADMYMRHDAARLQVYRAAQAGDIAPRRRAQGDVTTPSRRTLSYVGGDGPQPGPASSGFAHREATRRMDDSFSSDKPFNCDSSMRPSRRSPPKRAINSECR